MLNFMFGGKCSGLSILLLLLIALLSGCGGGGPGANGSGTPGGGSGGNAVATQSITGVVATGMALDGAVVTVVDRIGNRTVPYTTPLDGTGSFSIDVTGMTPPFLLKAEHASILPMYSVIPAGMLDMTKTSTKYVSITQLTTLVTLELNAGKSLGSTFLNPTDFLVKLTSKSLVGNAETAVLTRMASSLAASAVVNSLADSGFDILYQTFTINSSSYDTALENIGKITAYHPGEVILVTSASAPVTTHYVDGQLGVAVVVNGVVVTTGAASITADGATSTAIRAKVTDLTGAAAVGVSVTFTSSAGTLSGAASGITDSTGIASVNLTATTHTGSATVGASSSNVFATPVTVNFVAGSVASIGMNLQPSTVWPGGLSTVSIVVTDSNSNPVGAGQIINFSTVSGGIFSALSGTTDENGRATVSYVASLNSATPMRTELLSARASNGIPGTATLKVDSGIAVLGSIGLASTAASIRAGGATSVINATVKDTAGTAIAGVMVNFLVSSGTLSMASATTNSSGIATVILTSGASVLTANVTATSGGYTANTSVVYTAGSAVAISLNPAPNTAVPGGSAMIIAAVVDGNGNPVSGEVLTFSFAQKGSGTPALSATTVATDLNGLVRVTYTAGLNAGADIVTATASNAVAAAGAITVVSNAVRVGSILASSSKLSIPVSTGTTQISAVLKDVAGVVLAGQQVIFATSAGSLMSLSAVTDINGVATTYLLASADVLTSIISASFGGYTSNVSVAFAAGAANRVTVSAAPAAIKIAGTSTLSALVVDQNSNPVAGEMVTFALTVRGSGLPTLGSLTALTSANGLAVVTYLAGATAGTDSITATTSNAKTASVAITSAAGTTVVGSVMLTTGASSIASGGSGTYLRANVTDINGLPATGITVNFSSSAGVLSAGSALTDSLGIAQVTLNSSTKLGNANIVVNASGFVATTSVAFTSGNPSLVVLSGTNSLASGALTTLTAQVLDANHNPVSNETVNFGFTANPTGGTLASSTAITSVNGIAAVVYIAGATPATDMVVATLTDSLTKSSAVSLTVIAGASASTLSIGTSTSGVKSDNSNFATITVTAVNSNNVVVQGVTISFSSNGGTLSAGSAVTNAAGQAITTVSSGIADQSNRTITVTASSTSAGAVTIPILITGSAISLTTVSTVLVSGLLPTSTTLTVKASNAGGVGVYNMQVSLSDTTTLPNTGQVTITPASGYTDVNGFVVFTVTGQTSGTATVTASALGSNRTQDFTVSASGSEFKITAPASNPASLITNTGALPFTIQVGAAAITQVRLSTTIGTWSICTGTGVNTSVCILPWANPKVTATLLSSLAGVANVQVDGLDASNKVLVSDSRNVAMTSAIAGFVSLQSSISVIQPSSGTTTNSSTITASVRDLSNQPVGNAAVVFSLVNPTGGGESVSPALVLSSDGVASIEPIGQARATFTAGSLSTSSGGVTIRGMVVGSGNGICPASGGTAICGDTIMNIGGTAGSIVIGQPTTVGIVLNDTTNTTYQSSMNLLVSDSNGNPVKGAVVSLSAWPVNFMTGAYVKDITTGLCFIDPYAIFPNEDANQNLLRDAGEIVPVMATHTYEFKPVLYKEDNILTPANSAAGNLPATVTTDSNGLAPFNLVYLKQYSIWIETRITARTTVLGTESTSSLTFVLPAMASDVTSCVLSPSPYNP